MASNKRQEFRVEIDGLDLAEEVVQRINDAVRRVVLHELAAISPAGSSRSVDLLGKGFTARGIEHGGTQGIRVRSAEPE
jgi:hypothetical protein